ncbi:MAG: DEAD/DEAH box helicase [Thermoanaerobaculia bacterium]
MSLELFDPRIRSWFERRFGAPTEVQRLAWGPIADGRNVLLTAPTGSGKTLTAFLWALEQLATGAWEEGTTRVLYVSPLKALNADIERNLAEPLAEIAEAFRAAGSELPRIRVATRSGDTPPGERQKIVRQRPEILITTPESLNLLVNSKAGPALFAGLRTVILDEIHAVAAGKRGTHLITAVDRLVLFAGEFQRIALSATVRPLERIAAWVGGYRLERGADDQPLYVRRPVTIVESSQPKRYDVAVRFPPALAALPGERREGDTLWTALAEDLRQRIGEARSTLVFTNSRRLAEKITRLINDGGSREIAWSHHGSLSRELRGAIEKRLKAGDLPALVATSSLELGIDIGALDQVLLVQSPRSLASAAQRVGRAGHSVGEISRARLYPTHARDFLECAVAARAVLDGEIEPIQPVRAPLDLLAQWIVGMVAHERWRADDLHAFLRASEPYHELSRRQFDLVVEMLAGRYADARIAELRPRIAFDRLDGTIAARPGAARLVAQSGGTIPDRGYFQLRIEESNARLGELDEEFVWERALGDTFLLGTQSWCIQRITSNEVFVTPARGGAMLAPFWRADARDRGALFSEQIGRLLERADGDLERTGFAAALAEEYALDAAAAAELVRLLSESRAALGGILPHRHRLIFEETREHGSGGQGSPGEGRRQVVLYTFWGGTLNRPLALALAAAWEEAEGGVIETLADDDAVLLVLPTGADARALFALVKPERLENLLRARLESSGFFGAQFRQNAQRALLLPRAGPRRRTPLWVSRENAKKLLDAVARFDDFPVTLETWRSSLHDEFDLESLRRRLEEVERGEIELASVRSERPSPLAAGLIWRRTNELMYEDDAPGARRGTSVRGDLLREVALGGERPRIAPRLAEELRQKLQRLLPGYAPQSASELLEWVKERLLLPPAEWRELLAAIERDRPGGTAGMLAELAAGEKLATLVLAPDCGETVVARENLVRLADAQTPAATGARLSGLLEEWLRYQPPVAVERVAVAWGLSRSAAEAALAPLAAGERVIVGELLENHEEGATTQVATVGVVETLLRWRRAAARPVFEPLALTELPLFLACWQGLAERTTGGEGLQAALERLFGFPAPAGLWESALLPARLEPYYPAWLDGLVEASELVWFGAGRERIALAFRPDLDLFQSPVAVAEDAEPGSAAEVVSELLVREPRGLEVGELVERSGLPLAMVTEALWTLAWRGGATCTSLRVLRQGIQNGFRVEAPIPQEMAGGGSGRGGRRGLFRRWQGSQPLAGRWLALMAGRARDTGEAADPFVEEERSRERARLLLDRYGILFRELLAAEQPALAWSRVARALRGLELAGEIVAGRFFEGVPGLQFASPGALRRLREGLPAGANWWCSALDPASPCGLDLPGLQGTLPRRSASTRLAYRGSRLGAVFARGGREIQFAVPADDPGLPELLEPLRSALTRAVDAERGLDVEQINGEPAGSSAYFAAFAAFDRTRDGGLLRLRRRYAGREAGG